MEGPGILKLDFVTLFPHKFWISDWSDDEDPFRYKLLSARDEKQGVVELILVHEDEDGNKREMHRAHVKLAAVDGYARVFVEGLADQYGIDFEEQDFTTVRTAADFSRATAAHHWSEDVPVVGPN